MLKKLFSGFPNNSEPQFPKTIEGFGYKFNENGELRNIETNERFVFRVKPDDYHYNQGHYEALGEAIGEYVEDLLVSQFRLKRQEIPLNDEQPKSRIYVSEDYNENSTLLLLMQGSGVVRAGQWARQVIINDSLELGTMFPYIIKAQELGWGILIFNPNENFGDVIRDGEVDRRPIPGSETPQQHTLYVSAKAEKVLMVAHSFGGISTTALLDEKNEEFKSRVKVVAFTDSVHSAGMVPRHSQKWFKENTCNWIKSDRPFDTPIKEAYRYFGCKCFSAGHVKHEFTSGMAIESVFEFLKWGLEKGENNKTVNGDRGSGKFDADAASDNNELKSDDEEEAKKKKKDKKDNTETEDPMEEETEKKNDKKDNTETEDPMEEDAETKEKNKKDNTETEDPMEEDGDLSKSTLESDNVKLKSSDTKDNDNSLKTSPESAVEKETINKQKEKDEGETTPKPNSEGITPSNSSPTDKSLTISGNEVSNSIVDGGAAPESTAKQAEVSLTTESSSSSLLETNTNGEETKNHKNPEAPTKLQNENVNDITNEEDSNINSLMESSAVDLKESSIYSFEFDQKASTDSAGKMILEPRFGGLLWNLTSRLCMMSCSLIAKFFLRFCTKSTTVYNKEPFVRVLMDPNRTRPILTVANHQSTVDDPLLWGSLPFCTTKSTRTVRWTLGAQEICFTSNFLSHFFALGQVVPTVRGAGIYQPAMNFALDKLNEKEGNWVHIFPEGKINQTSALIPFRWGVGRLMMEAKNPPIVVPLWHKGLEEIMPEDRDNPFVPILWQKVAIAFGEPIDLKDILAEFHEGKAEEVATRIKISDVIFGALNDLKKKAEALEAGKDVDKT